MIKNTFFNDIKNLLFYKLSDASMWINFNDLLIFILKIKNLFSDLKDKKMKKLMMNIV